MSTSVYEVKIVTKYQDLEEIYFGSLFFGNRKQ